MPYCEMSHRRVVTDRAYPQLSIPPVLWRYVDGRHGMQPHETHFHPAFRGGKVWMVRSGRDLRTSFCFRPISLRVVSFAPLNGYAALDPGTRKNLRSDAFEAVIVV